MSAYLINGSPLETAWCILTDVMAGLVEPEGLGTATRAAGVDGGGFVAKVYPPFEFPLPLVVLDCDSAGVRASTAAEQIEQFMSNRAALLSLVRDPDAALRVIRAVGGDVVEASCELASPVEWAAIGPSNARCVVTLRNLDGLWAPSVGS